MGFFPGTAICLLFILALPKTILSQCQHDGIFENAVADTLPILLNEGDFVIVTCIPGWVNDGATTFSDNTFRFECRDSNIGVRIPEPPCMMDIDECTPTPTDFLPNPACTGTDTCQNSIGSYACVPLQCTGISLTNVVTAITVLNVGATANTDCVDGFVNDAAGQNTVLLACVDADADGIADPIIITPMVPCTFCSYGDVVNADQTTYIAANGASTILTCDDGWTTPAGALTFTLTCSGSGFVATPHVDPAQACATDLDECLITPALCVAPMDICQNTEGSYICSTRTCGDPGDFPNTWHEPVQAVQIGDIEVTMWCLDGWVTTDNSEYFNVSCEDDGSWTPPDGIRCDVDIDECDTEGICGVGGRCVNTNGTYYCLCDDGYYWENGDSGLSDGSCTETVCQAITAPDNSVEIDPPATWARGNVSVFQCNEGYEATHGHNDPDNLAQFALTCMDDGSTCGCSLPVCKPLDCGEPGNDKYTSHKEQVNTTYGSIATYACDAGYQTSSEDVTYQKTCGDGGIWVKDPTDAWCTEDIDECDDSCAGENEVCINTYGSYYCLCEKGWQWDDIILQNGSCIVRTCPVPPTLRGAEGSTLADGSTASEVDYGTRVLYTCAVGFQASHGYPPNNSSLIIVTCEDDERLHGSGIPSCEPVNCGLPGDDDFESHSWGNTYYEDEVEYECFPGFHVLDDTGTTWGNTYTKTCQANGTWTQPEYWCEDIDECLLELNCTEEGETCHNVPGSVICLCEELYTRVNDTCILITCGDPPVLEATEEPEWDSDTDGSLARYECIEGYQSCCHGETHINLTCTRGNWGPPVKGCKKKSCGDPGTVVHAYRNNSGFWYENVVGYNCSEGFHRSDSIDETEFWIRCQSDGTWTPIEYECWDINECENRENPKCTEEGEVCYNVPGSYFCGCDVGYRLVDGKCERVLTVPCDGAPDLEYANITNEDDMTANYTCEEGFTSCCSGPQIRLECMDGRWIPDVAGCKRIECRNPGMIAHANRNASDFLYQDEVTYQCQNGFQKNDTPGVSVITKECQADGSWSNPDDYCQDINECNATSTEVCEGGWCVNTIGSYHCKCPLMYYLNAFNVCHALPGAPVDPMCDELPDFDNAVKISAVSEMPVVYQCKEGYATAEGADEFSIDCILGNWVPKPRDCQKRLCKDPGLDSFARRVGNDFSLGAEVKYFCNEGYRVNVEDLRLFIYSRICESEGNITGWSNIDLTCEDINECTEEKDFCLQELTSSDKDASVTQGCRNLPGTYECYCADGYALTGAKRCEKLTRIARKAKDQTGESCSFFELFRHCRNGGTCMDGNEGPRCECKDGWKGVHCEEEDEDDPLSLPLLLSIISLALLLFTILILLCCCSMFFCRFTRRAPPLQAYIADRIIPPTPAPVQEYPQYKRVEYPYSRQPAGRFGTRPVHYGPRRSGGFGYGDLDVYGSNSS